MIQRIQTVYLLLAIIAVVLCMSNPIGVFLSGDRAPIATLYNLWISTELNNQIHHTIMPWVALFGLQAFTATIQTLSIFMFNKRALQMRMVNLSMLLLIGYYIAVLILLLTWNYKNGLALWTSLRPTVWLAMPFVALVLSYLAFRAILKDELLVRSLDRLR